MSEAAFRSTRRSQSWPAMTSWPSRLRRSSNRSVTASVLPFQRSSTSTKARSESASMRHHVTDLDVVLVPELDVVVERACLAPLELRRQLRPRTVVVPGLDGVVVVPQERVRLGGGDERRHGGLSEVGSGCGRRRCRRRRRGRRGPRRGANRRRNRQGSRCAPVDAVTGAVVMGTAVVTVDNDRARASSWRSTPR